MVGTLAEGICSSTHVETMAETLPWPPNVPAVLPCRVGKLRAKFRARQYLQGADKFVLLPDGRLVSGKEFSAEAGFAAASWTRDCKLMVAGEGAGEGWAAHVLSVTEWRRVVRSHSRAKNRVASERLACAREGRTVKREDQKGWFVAEEYRDTHYDLAA